MVRSRIGSRLPCEAEHPGAGLVAARWEGSAECIPSSFELHRSSFLPDSLLGVTELLPLPRFRPLPFRHVKHQGKALGAAAAMVARIVIASIFLSGFVTLAWPRSFLLGALVAFLGLVATLFTLHFFRDPNPRVPSGPGLVVAPGHGKVDVVDQLEEPVVMGGRCQRVSIFLSVFDVHVQQSPVAGSVTEVRHQPGKFLNALKTESAAHNENVLIGFRADDPPGTPVGVRLIAGLIARRIVPWLRPGEDVRRGERISLIQFGSRVDLYLPLSATLTVRNGQRVVGGETVVARLS